MMLANSDLQCISLVVISIPAYQAEGEWVRERGRLRAEGGVTWCPEAGTGYGQLPVCKESGWHWSRQEQCSPVTVPVYKNHSRVQHPSPSRPPRVPPK